MLQVLFRFLIQLYGTGNFLRTDRLSYVSKNVECNEDVIAVTMTINQLSSHGFNRKRHGNTNERCRNLSFFGIFVSVCLGAGIYILSISFWMDESTSVYDRSIYSKSKAFLVRQMLPKVVDENNFTKGDAVDGFKKNIFPSPLEQVEGGKIIMRPTYGSHRPDSDAVFSFAQGYSLRDYIRFVETLQKTGYRGDIVLSVASVDKLDQSILTYLKSKKNLVVYAVSWRCFKRNGEPLENPDEYALCQILNFTSAKNSTTIANDDIRMPLPLATARFELFWAWSLQYRPSSLLLLIDFRDVFFQLDPFIGITRSLQGSKDGLLYFYEERQQLESFILHNTSIDRS